MKKLLFVLVMGALIFAVVGCNSSNQTPPPNPPPIPPQVPHMPNATKRIVVYDFWAPWCPPCRAFGPTFDAWKKKYGSNEVEFKKVNTDEEKDLTQKFNIGSIPCIIITKDGKEVRRWTGAPKESEIQEYLR